MIILDTNVLSEQTRLRPAESVMNWARTQVRKDLFTTSITEAEIRLGVELMPAGRKRRDLEEQVHRMFAVEFKMPCFRSTVPPPPHTQRL